MELGMGKLGIPPREFWQLTLREIRAIYFGRFGRSETETPLTQADIREMEEKYLGHDPRRTRR